MLMESLESRRLLATHTIVVESNPLDPSDDTQLAQKLNIDPATVTKIEQSGVVNLTVQFDEVVDAFGGTVTRTFKEHFAAQYGIEGAADGLSMSDEQSFTDTFQTADNHVFFNLTDGDVQLLDPADWDEVLGTGSFQVNEFVNVAANYSQNVDGGNVEDHISWHTTGSAQFVVTITTEDPVSFVPTSVITNKKLFKAGPKAGLPKIR